MRALVTGGAGFIGSALAHELIAAGAEVRVFDNLSTGRIESVPQGAEFVLGDLCDPGEVADACRDIEVVFHQAAIRSVPRSMDDPGLTNDSNVTGTLNLLRAASAHGVRKLVYASSSSAYGDSETRPLSEDLSPRPLSPYAVSKLAGEYYCGVWSQSFGLPTVSLRYFNVFGPGQRPDSKYAAVFPAFTSALVNGRAPEIHWDGEQSRDFTFIDDVVRANIAAAEAGSRCEGEVVNIGSNRPRTINEVLRSVSAALDRWIEPEMKPKRPGDVRHTHADTTKAWSLLGWRPEVEWSDAVALTVDWFLRGTRTPSEEPALQAVETGTDGRMAS
ncbi:MAG: SDR family oxidoreductase [Actinomycetota bacterium]